MRATIVLFCLSLIAFSSCKKCTTCVGEFSNQYIFDDGETLTVSEGEVTYKDEKYSEGETFTIAYDSTAVNDGLRFTGTGMVEMSDQFCGKGRRYKDQLYQYEKLDWRCTED